MTRQQRRAAERAAAKAAEQAIRKAAEAARVKVWLGRDLHEPRRACPICHVRLEAAFAISLTGFDNEPMRPGQITICAYCSSTLYLQPDDTFRHVTADEFAELDPVLQRIIGEWDGKRGPERRMVF